MSGPSLNAQVFNPPGPGSTGDALVGAVMRLVSPPVGAVLAALDAAPRTPQWLARVHGANAERMWRLSTEVGLVEPIVGWFGKLKLWRLTQKGKTYLRVWSEEMERRRRTSTHGGLSWLPGEEPQPGDTVITSGDIHANITRGGGDAPSLPAGMRSGLRIVPHDRRARDIVYTQPDDKVAALGLLEEGDASLIDYLVGANEVPTDAARMKTIMADLVGEGLAVERGAGWVRTPFGTRMHQTWSGAPGSEAQSGQH